MKTFHFIHTPALFPRTLSSFPRRRESSGGSHRLGAGLWTPAFAGVTGWGKPGQGI